MAALRPITDGLITIRPPAPGDREVLIAGRDPVSRRFLGEGSPDPRPTACIVDGEGQVVGWVDYDRDHRPWLAEGEVNLGYNVFVPHRGRGYATRAVRLLVHHLAVGLAAHESPVHTATALIDPQNAASLNVATGSGFVRCGEVDGQVLFRRPVPPLVYSDGIVTVRPPRPDDDLVADLAAKDDEQIRWLWEPGQRESWEAMSDEQQRAHALRGLRANASAFGAGPKWTFCVDAPGAPYVAYVDCDLGNPHVSRGEANVSYSAHPAHRGKGYVSRAVRLVSRFVAEHTGAREAHIIVDAENSSSLRVAAAVGATARETFDNDHGRRMVRHVLPLRVSQ